VNFFDHCETAGAPLQGENFEICRTNIFAEYMLNAITVDIWFEVYFLTQLDSKISPQFKKI